MAMINAYITYSAVVGICLGADSVINDIATGRELPPDNSLGIGRTVDIITRGAFMTIVGAVFSPVVTVACIADLVNHARVRLADA